MPIVIAFEYEKVFHWMVTFFVDLDAATRKVPNSLANDASWKLQHLTGLFQ